MGTPVAVQFTEVMRGFISRGAGTFRDGFDTGKAKVTPLMFRLTIRVEDIDKFVDDTKHAAEATGFVECETLGGRLTVVKGEFGLFVKTGDSDSRKMLYRLFLTAPDDRTFTLSGFKHVQNSMGADIWADTTTLFVNLFSGHVDGDEEATSELVATGIVHIEAGDFAHQLTTFRSSGPSIGSRLDGIAKFGRVFFGALWDVYRPSILPRRGRFQREIPLYTTEGVSNAEVSTHSFQSRDQLGLSMLRFRKNACKDVVLIVHGLTTSSDMFIMPEHYNLVQFLLDRGFEDVFTLDFRMSNRFSYNLQRHRYNLDDIALNDFPPSIDLVRRLAEPEARIHVICHCLGSVAFLMSLFGKAVGGITSVVSNSVSLTPRVPRWSRIKLLLGPFFVENFTSIEYINPNWRRLPGFGMGKVLSYLVSAFHRECDVPECHMLSFMWGTGTPAVYRHENLLDVTHRRGGDLYGGVSLHYYRHVSRMVSAGNTAVKFSPRDARYNSLPDNYFQFAREITTPVMFVTGQQNNIFLDSNVITHRRLQEIVPGRHELDVIPGYGHQDVFMGRSCHVDVFPRMVSFMNRFRN
jgi:cholesterol oxidase